MADSRPASRLLHHRISIARAVPRTNAMNLLAFYQLPESRWATRKLAEPQKLESDLESAYKSKMAVWGIIFMSSALGMVLGMAMLVRWCSRRHTDRESAMVHALETSRG
ncbi:hypothetical protein Esi_1484_0001 [Ectocarpus siliculosus]|uniref:Uncharacterized protein n=1 Tax=Ectocarpus siliculosus TaxID=2880 RepID=D7FKT0_ECTSI|nr:hypothetical protein Esi_1484_0001 [Ectocarpus siliculosus]|eukprot:CBJ34210.1 hypothetical protein Esi_1484_0001 [Ectocarpus siliculosus]